jgi:chemotaxis protein CheY-P-specific phosphatase CheC
MISSMFAKQYELSTKKIHIVNIGDLKNIFTIQVFQNKHMHTIFLS